MFQKLGVDAVFLANTSLQDANFCYFSGLAGAEHAVLLLFPKDKVLFLSEMEFERARRSSGIKDIRTSKDPFADASAELLERKVKHLGVNKRFIPVSLVEKLPFVLVDCSGHLSSLRAVKSKEEVSRIKKAGRIALKALDSVSFSGSERTIAASIDFALSLQAMTSFQTIVAGDSHSSMPHHVPSSYSPRSLVLADFGARFENYCSDITRMHYFRKKPEFERIHSIVRDAQELAIGMIRPGVKARDVDSAVRSFFESKGLAGYFLHSTGHGIGIEVHEAPLISPNSRDVLKEGMVFALEPGLYLKRFGCRIEDNVVVTRSGCRSLT